MSMEADREPVPVRVAAPPESITLNGFKGLRNVVSAERLGRDDLAKAQNVDLDDAGQVHRRRGYELEDSCTLHSLWTSKNGRMYGVRNGSLGYYVPNHTFTSLTSVGSDKLAYVEIGNTIYFASKTVSGKLVDNVPANWGELVSEGEWHSPVVLPTATLGEVQGKLIGPPPMAEYLAYLNGRIYLALGNLVWATELYLYDYVDKTRTFIQFEGDVTGLVAVSDGLYVGTTTGLWFCGGPFGEMRRIPITTDAVIPGSMLPALGDDFPDSLARNSKLAAIIMTRGGLCAGFDGGVYANLTGDRFWFPDAMSAAAMLRKQDGMTQYVGVTDNGGTPVQTARMGDYVDAEIRRFSGD